MTLKDNTARMVLSTLLRQPDKVVLGDLDTTLSRAGLLANVTAQANAMLEDGLAADDFLVLFCNRGLSFWVELLAAWVIGAKPICVEANITQEPAASVLSMTGVSRILGATDTTTEVFAELDRLRTTFDPELKTEDLLTCYSELPFAAEADLPDLAGLIFTSGTTGLPKGVPLTHRALNANALATAYRLRLLPSDRLLIATPFRFISSISHFLVTSICGASFFGLEKPMMIKDLIDAINGLDVTAFGGSPFHVQFLALAGQGRLPSLRWVMSSGDHLRPAVIEQMQKSFDNLELHVVYGMAELGGRFCQLPPEALREKAGSVGFPINGFEVSIRKENGDLCPPGEIGDLYVGGTLGFDGYYNNPTANKKVLHKNGFLNGDKGYIDKDGYLFLSGRSDAVFKRSGLKVSAQVITDAIMEFAEVRDAFVSGEEDTIEGRVPVAYVCWDGDERPDEQNLTQRLRNVLASNHIPARYVSLPTIPRTASGKVDRRKLNQLIEEHR